LTKTKTVVYTSAKRQLACPCQKYQGKNVALTFSTGSKKSFYYDKKLYCGEHFLKN